tara:strand:- start:189 stop:371 length:183 start_codon:yes stop_codon:yes gene_type:complete
MPVPGNKKKVMPVALTKGRFVGRQQGSVPSREIVDPLPVVHRGVTVSRRHVRRIICHTEA